MRSIYSLPLEGEGRGEGGTRGVKRCDLARVVRETSVGGTAPFVVERLSPHPNPPPPGGRGPENAAPVRNEPNVLQNEANRTQRAHFASAALALLLKSENQAVR
jgi:hypothetical protein